MINQRRGSGQSRENEIGLVPGRALTTAFMHCRRGGMALFMPDYTQVFSLSLFLKIKLDIMNHSVRMF